MREEALIVLRMDTGDLPAKSQQAAQSLAQIGVKGEISARQTAAAMRILPAQLTDVATQLAGGQNPLLILLQQGGQVKDSFGGIGPAIRGIGAAITPAMVGIGAVGAAVGILALALHEGAAQDTALRNSLLLTGNAAGLTSSRLQLMAEQTSEASRQTVGGARDIVMALAGSGQVSNKVLDSMSKAVALVADVSGEDAKKIAADFAGMSGGVAKWAAEHNKAWNFISVEQYRYIRRLEEQGKAEEAMIFLNQRLTDRFKGQKQNLGLLESAWDTVRKAATGAWDAMLGVGREQSARTQLDIAQARLAAMGDNLQPKARAAAEQRIQFLKEQIKLEGQSADAQSRNAATNRKAIADERANEGKEPVYVGAIRGGLARGQYDYLLGFAEVQGKLVREKAGAQADSLQMRNDFLRSEKAFYVELDKMRKEELEAGRKDPLGEFLTETVLPAAQKRDEALLASRTNYLQQLLDGNERAGLELIEDERARGEALIALDRSIAQRRLQEQGFTGPARDEAQRLLDEQALASRRTLEVQIRRSNDKTADEAGQQTYDDVKGALSAAFRDSNNPAKAFAAALGNAIFQRVSAGMADALATAAVGKGGNGGLLGQALDFLGSFNGGYSVDTGGIGTNNTGTSLPTRGGLATGTNYVPRNMVVKVHQGEAIVPRQYNPAAGGAAVGGGGVQHITYNLPPGYSPADMADKLADNNRRLKAEFAADVSRPGRGLNNAVLAGL